MPLVDSHSHFDADEFDADRLAALTRARDAGVDRQILPAVTEASWQKLRNVCLQHEGLYPAYGLHPLFLEYHHVRHLASLRDWIECERPVAIGECGLDFYVEGLDAEMQHRYFDGQLQLAREFDLPVIVHARRAVEAVIVAIKRIGQVRGVVHSFPGSEEQARQLWNLGFMIGIGGPVTYERANRLRRLVATMPIEHLLLETDSPDQPDAAHRCQRNEPARLPIVLKTIAELRCEGETDVAAATTANAQRLFGLGSTEGLQDTRPH